VFLARHHDLDLLRDIAQPTQDHPIPIAEPEDRVFDPDVLAEVLDGRLHAAQVVARDAREEVVHGLELEAAVYEVELSGAVDVHGGAELLLGERLGGAEVRGGHAEVGERDLNVQRHGDDVRDQHEGDA
jgi:hypothetical protein